jgi:pimeloyl-ACP methyl ester carboxylesterase
MSARLPRAVPAVALFLGCAVAISAAEPAVVILKDGFVVQGQVHKEIEVIVDKASGRSIPIIKSNGFDMINEGPKVTIFSTHAKQLGAIAPDTKLRPEYKAFTTNIPGFKSFKPLPGPGDTTVDDWDPKRWFRKISVKVVGAAPEVIDQQITYMDPYYIAIRSATHRWWQTYRTAEWDPKLVRRLLMGHPQLAEPDGKCDPLKRVMLAQFLLDTGWLQLAKDEIDRLKRDHSGEMEKGAKEQYDKLIANIDVATGELVAREAELALRAGRYKYAAELIAAFPEKTAAPKEVTRVAKVSADLKVAEERYDAARRHLRNIIDEIAGLSKVNALVALAGGGALATWVPPKNVPGLVLDLAAAGERVYAELHPDSAIRIETFVTLAAQAERERAAGKEPTKKPEELLATAVSGWAKGKNGARPIPDEAWQLWTARELVLAYQRGNTMNERNAVLGRYKKNITLGTDELAQMISLLPPAQAEDLENRTGTQVPLGKVKDTGLYKRTTLPAPGHPQGIDYLVKLPPEYHHGRPYPVLLVLTHPGISTEDVLNPILAEADRNGYIVVAPEWAGRFNKVGWEYKGEDHVFVTAALRDAVRHFTVDNDKVFLLGVGDGANMAMDVGASHPDLFAGVVPVGPIPKYVGFFDHYYANCQKLPFFVITGDQTGAGMLNLRRIYEKWMPYGFPAIWSVYRGRGVEWFAAESPVIFDWMGRKTRVSGTATLALGDFRQPWHMLRPTDTRFYWMEADEIVTGRSGGAPVPATIQGDIRGNNVIAITQKGVKRMTIWLSAELIDWTKPVRVSVNGAAPAGWAGPKNIAPSVEILLEDYFVRGDRRMLVLNKIELKTVP